MNLESGRRWTENAFPFNTGEKWVQISSTSNNFLRIACGNLFHFDDIIWKRRAFFSRHYARVLSVISFSVPLTSRPELRSRRVRMIIRNYLLKMTAAAIVTCNHDSLCKVLISNGSTPRRQRQQLPWWNRHLGIAAAGSQTFSLPRGPVTISTVAISRDKDQAKISLKIQRKWELSPFLHTLNIQRYQSWFCLQWGWSPFPGHKANSDVATQAKMESIAYSL